MTLIMIARGRYREPDVYRNIEGEMGFYGEIHRWMLNEDIGVSGIGAPLSVVSSGSLSVASPQLSRDELEGVLTLALEGGLATEAASRWSKAEIVSYDSSSGDIVVVRGQFCGAPMWCAHDGADFLITPSTRFFRHVASSTGCFKVEKGNSLSYEPAAGSYRIGKGQRSWERDRLEDHDYEEDKARLRSLLRESTASLLEGGPYPMAISLSGGLDSAIVAHLCVDLGKRLPAYNVTFEQKWGRIPLDLKRARLTAKRLNLDLHEIIVKKKEIPSLIRETVSRSSVPVPFTVEGLIYFTRLCQQLERDGIASCLLGTGIDALLGAHRELGRIESDEEFQSVFVRTFRALYGLEPVLLIQQSFRVRFLRPLVSESIEAFCLSLPREFIVAGKGESFVGKKIARDAFASELPSEIITGGKSLPPSTTGAERQLKAVLGSSARRAAHYRRLYSELVLGRRAPSQAWSRRMFSRFSGG